MTDPVGAAARATAERLAADYGPGLAADVEAELRARNSAASRPARFIDPVSIGTLIVAIATLAWTVYTDLCKKTPEPSHETIARHVRVALRERSEPCEPDTSRITEIVVTEIIRATGQPR